MALKIKNNIQNRGSVSNSSASSTSTGTDSLFLTPCTEFEILKYLHSLKDGSAAGEDGITAVDLKSIQRVIAEPLCHI